MRANVPSIGRQGVPENGIDSRESDRPADPFRPADPLSKDTVVVLPTYNEAENIDTVVGAVRAYGYAVLIVDDASPDGTGEIADRIADGDSGVEVLHRASKQGLGAAYSAAYAYVVDRYEVIVQMDADLSHDPVDIPRLTAAIQNGADVVIGSRYVAGGGIGDWSMFRRLLSSGGNRFARLMVGGQVQDMTSGFRAFRSSALNRLDPGSCTAAGYAFQVEMAARAESLSLVVQEIPIIFRDRVRGTSKMDWRVASEAVRLFSKWGVQRLMRKLRFNGR